MSIPEERRKYLLEKLKHAAREFGKAGTRSDHQEVPKEEQLSIDLGNKKIFGIANKISNWVEHTCNHNSSFDGNFSYIIPSLSGTIHLSVYVDK